ncbi:hypothetical protein LTS15_004937 [Exophiala xenobiotica]|nr:hypothetical protein LTS15_004937 [Exophiala xenobiotica]
MQSARYSTCPCHHSREATDDATEDPKLLKKAPAVQAEITRILGKGDGWVPILYEANVRVPYTASRQVFMGAPGYAKAWPNALKTDGVLAVIEGNANTIEQVKYIGTILSINKRMVFTKKFLLSFTNSPYTIKKFRYGFKFARHTFEESTLLTTMATIHDIEWQSNSMKAFEKESLDMKMMPIAGTKGGKLYGFALRPEDHDYPLSDGIHFKMFFKRDKAAEERAAKKAKKAAKEAKKASKLSEKVDEDEDAAQPTNGIPETEPACSLWLEAPVW